MALAWSVTRASFHRPTLMPTSLRHPVMASNLLSRLISVGETVCATQSGNGFGGC
jgi:hypothetical protein